MKQALIIADFHVITLDQDKLEKIKTSMLVKIYQDYLDDTDHKFSYDYEPKVGETPEDLENIRVQRSIARTFIRKNEDV